MKDIKLYNVIFPIWFIWIFPPVILVALVGNFIIDSIVLLISLKVLKSNVATGLTVKELYKKTIKKVWVFGFISDIIGAAPLFIAFLFTGLAHRILSQDVQNAVYMNPFTNIWGFLIVFSCLILAAIFIYIFNYNYTFKKVIEDKTMRMKVCIILAVATAPWTFLIPTEWMMNTVF